MNTMINWNNGTITVTDNLDGTFFVRVDGVPVGRWLTREIAERRAENIRKHQPKAA